MNESLRIEQWGPGALISLDSKSRQLRDTHPPTTTFPDPTLKDSYLGKQNAPRGKISQYWHPVFTDTQYLQILYSHAGFFSWTARSPSSHIIANKPCTDPPNWPICSDIRFSSTNRQKTLEVRLPWVKPRPKQTNKRNSKEIKTVKEENFGHMKLIPLER